MLLRLLSQENRSAWLFLMNQSIDHPIQYVTSSLGEQLAYQFSAGAEPVVVFFPGYASDMFGSKANFLDAWCSENRQAYLRFDYSGHGESQGRFVEGTIAQWTDDALRIIEKSTSGPVVLVGSSMGGWIMLLAALVLKERVTGLVGIAAAPDFTEDLVWRSLDTEQRKTLTEKGQVYPPSDFVEDPFPITLKLIEEARNQLLLHAPIALDCPVRLIHGLADPDVPWRTSLRLANQLTSKDVEIRLLKGGGHRLSDEAHLKLIARTVWEVIQVGG